MAEGSPLNRITHDFLNRDGNWTAGIGLAIAAVPLVLLLLTQLLSPTFDPREPLAVKPRIPFIGHIISIIREPFSTFYGRLYKEHKMPICSLPMLNGKMYVINSPSLITAAMRNKDLSFEPFSLEFSQVAIGYSKDYVPLFTKPGVLDELHKLHHVSMSGEQLYQMNYRAMQEIGGTLNNIKAGDVVDIADVWIWLQDLAFRGAMAALFGKENPIPPEAVKDVSDYEDGLIAIIVNILPNIFAKKAIEARGRVQDLMAPWFAARRDSAPDVSALLHSRANVSRRLGIPDGEAGRIEFGMPWVATTNTVPTLLWVFTNVFSRPGFVERIRDEVEAFVTIDQTGDDRVVTMNITKVEKQCVFLKACFNETQRVYNDNTGNRRVMQDTILRDDDGTEYLLKKGTNVQWNSGLTHNLPEVWGDRVSDFDPERFINTSSVEEKKRRGAMIPFGGGKTLCPGRNFAVAEIFGLLGCLSVGYVVEGAQVPDHRPAMLGRAVRRPDWSSASRSIKVKRRPGWENVEWKFTV